MAELSNQVGEPGELGAYYDPLSYAAYDHPYEVYRELRDRAPVFYSARSRSSRYTS